MKEAPAVRKRGSRWEGMAEFKDWLEPAPGGDVYKARCRLCNVIMTSLISSLRKHMTSPTHLLKTGDWRSSRSSAHDGTDHTDCGCCAKTASS